MNEKSTIETQLDCRATAALSESVLADLSKPDLPMDTLLKKEEEDKGDESTDEYNTSG